MLPFVEIFGKSVASYGLMAVLGCLVTLVFVSATCKKYGASWVNELYLAGFILVFAVVGAKVLYLVGHLSDFWVYADTIFSSPKAFFNYFGNGFVFYGGLIGGALGVVCYARFYKENTVKLAEAFVPGIPLFHFFGRIGCFMAGCCYGIPVKAPWGVVFTQSIGAPNGVSLLPIQLIEAGANLVTFVILVLMKPRKEKPLFNFGVYLIIYSIERFVFEFFRGDIIRGAFLAVSTSQWISLLLLPVGIYIVCCKAEKNIFSKLLYGNLK